MVRHGDPSAPSGSKAIGLSIGLVVFAALAALPFGIPAAFYVVANLYALTKGSTFSSDTANVGVLLTLLALTVAAFVIALSVLVALFGRSLSPKRRRE